MRGIDLSSWESVVASLVGLALFALIGVGIRLVKMMTFQQRRERANRQINERLKTLIAAYKTLGGSFTGQLQVSPAHMRDLRTIGTLAPGTSPAPEGTDGSATDTAAPIDADPDAASPTSGSDRQRRIRDAVEAALSDVILLGTEEQVQLAAAAAHEMVAGRSVEVAQLVVSLRHFIREALDLEPIPSSLLIPHQGPLRPGGAAGGGASGRRGSSGQGAAAAGGRAGGGAGGGGAGGGVGAMALGAGAHGITSDAPGSDAR